MEYLNMAAKTFDPVEDGQVLDAKGSRVGMTIDQGSAETGGDAECLRVGEKASGKK